MSKYNQRNDQERQSPPEQTAQRKQPADVLRSSNLKATIWEQKTENGSMFNTTLTRSYTDKDGRWQETGTLRERDNLPAGELLRQSHNRINELRREIAERGNARTQDQEQER